VTQAVSRKNLVVLHIISPDAYAYDPTDKYNAATQFTHVPRRG
jgi:hypothetical protein